jgi:hypothetical protein
VGESEKDLILHLTGGRTPKYKMREKTELRVYSCTGPTADQQFKLIELEMSKERRVQEDHLKMEAYRCILRTRGWAMAQGDEHCL